MENLRTNSLSTAQLNFQTAQELCKSDPLVYNELGVTFFKRKLYNEAKETFLRALEMTGESESWVKETILCNIGHSYRKAG
jgi:anaphase-promoting complex subunit 6